ncbi:hypothetical protein [Saccharopolyspora griseoalba]|uniref:Integral membrane protein n=1 Tax=Saccharopolyspora griseoalba TaxID=1431848 RepID=A0ABW2LQK7_9PSEU
MTSPQDDHPTPKRRRWLGIAAAAALLVLLLLAGGCLVALWTLSAAMAFGDACTFTPGSLHCPSGEISTVTQGVFMAILPAGLLIGLILGAVGGVLSIRRGGTGLRWAGMAWGAFALSLVVAVIVGSQVMW